jgi:hypothetical protein
MYNDGENMIGDEIQIKAVELAKEIDILNEELFKAQITVDEIIRKRQVKRTEELFDLFERTELLRDELLYRVALVDIFNKFYQPLN